MTTPEEPETKAPTMDDFLVLCEVVDLALGVPGGVADHTHNLSWQGQAALEAYAEMRKRQRDV